jgi:hypothetical protein
MTFDDILDQVIALLKRQGRVSYRALKRRFGIDDDYIEDLKEELLYVHPVIDDDAKGLIWTGEPESAPASTSALPFKWLQVLGCTEPPHIDKGVSHQLHGVVPTLEVLEPQQKALEFVLPRKRPLDAIP